MTSGPRTLRLTVSMAVLVLFSTMTVLPVHTSAQGTDITVYIGPFFDEKGTPIPNGKVLMTYGSESRNATTATNGTAKLFVPSAWLNKTVTVRFQKDTYAEVTFTGAIGASANFIPSNGGYPTIQNAHAAPSVDYTFLVVALIALVVLAAVLLGMKDTGKAKHKDDDEEKGEEPVEDE